MAGPMATFAEQRATNIAFCGVRIYDLLREGCPNGTQPLHRPHHDRAPRMQELTMANTAAFLMPAP